MAYLKPPGFVSKILNPLITRTGALGTVPLTVAGRTSGEPRTVPVTPIEVDGHTYLVSVRGEADWVKNVRSAGHVTVGRGGKAVAYAVRELPVDERAPVLKAYLDGPERGVASIFAKLPDAKDHPVFELVPASGSW